MLRRFGFVAGNIRTTVGVFLLCTLVPSVFAQETDLSFLTTRAERTDYVETTRYDELMGFLEVATAQSPRLQLTTFGYSTEGRALPLVVYGNVSDTSPTSIRATGKLRVYVQGNIHAGEVCGKEALLMLIRDLASGRHAQWANSLVVLLAPIYNVDGNERINLFNRSRQNGPYGGMGQRPNAQGLDLNRDHIKVKSPEARALIQLMNEYDPHVLVDLHTTNGTQHAYHLTYSPPLNPNTATEITSFLRVDMLPDITETIRKKHGWEYYYYGNLPFRRGSEPGWYTFDHRPRFNNNYAGLRNRIAILSEAYAYASFEERILASLYFVEEILNYSHSRADDIRRVIEDASAVSVIGLQLAVRSDFERSEEPVDILLGETHTKPNPFSGEMVRVRDEATRSQRMFEYGTFAATESERVPSKYYVSAEARIVREYLDLHGIQYKETNTTERVAVESFTIDSTEVSPRVFQNIRERTVYGSYSPVEKTLEPGTLEVSVDQELGRLIFYLLEPRSDDGLVNWALLDAFIEVGGEYPVYRSID